MDGLTRENVVLVLVSAITVLWLFFQIVDSWWSTGISNDSNRDWWEVNKTCRHAPLLLPPDALICRKTGRLIQVSSTGLIRKQTGSKRVIRRFYSAVKKIKEISFGFQGLSWTIDGSKVPANYTPILCFVNSKSGGSQGHFLIEELKQYLNPLQVVEVSTIDPIVLIKEFSSCLKQYKVLVCGGDGTISWILNSIQSLGPEESHPEVAILPIGTGNDLSIELGWGESFGGAKVREYLESIMHAPVVELDRWRFSISGSEPHKFFQNYCGFGVDASIVFQFHCMRSAAPSRFFHRWVNKLWYGIVGWREIWTRTNAKLETSLSLYAVSSSNQKRQIILPDDTEGIVFLNISSYGGGSKLWYNDDYDCDPPISIDIHQAIRNSKNLRTSTWIETSISDSILEVVAVKGSFELARVKLGIANCKKLAQFSHFEIVSNRSLHIQVDGEPWIQRNTSTINISPAGKVKMLKRPSQGIDKNIIDLLNWATEREIISYPQQQAIADEYNRRLEAITEECTPIII